MHGYLRCSLCLLSTASALACGSSDGSRGDAGGAIDSATDPSASDGEVTVDDAGSGEPDASEAGPAQPDAARPDADVSKPSCGSDAGLGTAAALEDAEVPLVQTWKPRIAVDAEGNVVTIWNSQPPGSPLSALDLWASRYAQETGWSAPTLLETQSDSVTEPALVMDGDGAATALWVQGGALWARRYSTAGDWDAAEQLVSDGAGVPVAAGNASGAMAVVWESASSETHMIYALRYEPEAGWDADATLISAPGASASQPDVVVDADGNIAMVWMQGTTDTTRSLWARQYVASSGWAPATAVVDAFRSNSRAHVALDGTGHPMVVWVQREPTTGRYPTDSLRVRRYSESSWEPEVVVQGASETILAVDAQEGIIVWAGSLPQYLAEPTPKAVSYKRGSGWTPPVALATRTITDGPLLAASPSGKAVAMWSYNKALYVATRRYDGDSWGCVADLSVPSRQEVSLGALALDPEGVQAAAEWVSGGVSWVNRF